MRPLVSLLTILLPALYAVLAAGSISLFVTKGRVVRKIWLPLLGVTLGLHALAMVLRGVATGQCPLGTVFEALEVAAFALMGVYFILEVRGGTRPTGILILPLAFLLEVVAVAFRRETGEPNPALANPWFSVHAAAAVLGIAALAVSFVHGVFYLLLYREIKEHRFGVLFRRLPPLAVLNRMTQTAAVIGWGLLTLTIGAGYVWALQGGHLSSMKGDPLFLVTLAAWVMYSAALGIRYVAGWRGRYTVYLSVCGFALLLVVLTVVSILWPSVHEFR